jgi:hypothetical protein
MATMPDATVSGRALGAGTGARSPLSRAQLLALLPDMTDATVSGRALGAGTGPRSNLSRAQVLAILPDMTDGTVSGRALGAGTGARSNLSRAQVEAILPDMTDGTVSGRALGAGTGARSGLSQAQLAAIASPALPGLGLVHSSGQLHVRAIYADFAVNVPTVAAAALGFVDVSVAGTVLDPLAVGDDISVIPKADAPPCSHRVSAVNTVRLGFQGDIAAIASAPFRIYRRTIPSNNPANFASAWLRVASATVTGSGVSSLPDLLNANPAVMATDSKRPPLGSSANGLPILTFTNGSQMLQWPLNTSNNTRPALGFAFWYKPGSVSSFQLPFGITLEAGSAGHYKFMFPQATNALALKCFFSGTANGRGGQSSLALNVGQWYFVTGEYYSAGGAEALRHVLTIDGAVQSLTFSSDNSGGSGDLLSTSGNAIIGGSNTTGGLPCLVSGSALGPNIFAFNARMPGATEGLLTPAARAALMSFEAPT